MTTSMPRELCVNSCRWDFKLGSCPVGFRVFGVEVPKIRGSFLRVPVINSQNELQCCGLGFWCTRSLEYPPKDLNVVLVCAQACVVEFWVPCRVYRSASDPC